MIIPKKPAKPPKTAKKRRKSPLTKTPRGRIVSAIRKLWLHSPERAAALKRTGYKCEACKRKQSVAKGKELSLDVHHLDEIGDAWDEIVEMIYRHILVDPEKLMPLCPECHQSIHTAK